MTSIYDEFRHLADGDPGTLQLIQELENSADDLKTKRAIAGMIWKRICPACPPGQRHARGSFWGQAIDNAVWWGLFGHNAGQKASWLRYRRVRGAKLVPHFEPMPRLPQPSARRV